MATSTRRADLDLAATLCGLTVLWNALAGTAAVAIGFASNSLTLAGFGLSATVDSIASVTLVWRFRAEVRDASRATDAERSALRIVGLTLLAIAAYITIRAFVALATRSSPESPTEALLLAVASVLVLSPLALGKWRLAGRLSSRALRADSVLSGVGAALALVTVLGLALTRTLPGWWWADAVGALLMSAVLFREGFTALKRKENQATSTNVRAP